MKRRNFLQTLALAPAVLAAGPQSDDLAKKFEALRATDPVAALKFIAQTPGEPAKRLARPALARQLTQDVAAGLKAFSDGKVAAVIRPLIAPERFGAGIETREARSSGASEAQGWQKPQSPSSNGTKLNWKSFDASHALTSLMNRKPVRRKEFGGLFVGKAVRDERRQTRRRDRQRGEADKLHRVHPVRRAFWHCPSIAREPTLVELHGDRRPLILYRGDAPVPGGRQHHLLVAQHLRGNRARLPPFHHTRLNAFVALEGAIDVDRIGADNVQEQLRIGADVERLLLEFERPAGLGFVDEESRRILAAREEYGGKARAIAIERRPAAADKEFPRTVIDAVEARRLCLFMHEGYVA